MRRLIVSTSYVGLGGMARPRQQLHHRQVHAAGIGFLTAGHGFSEVETVSADLVPNASASYIVADSVQAGP
eukprot:3953130-Pyramimonas_sp.AAC.1